MKDYSDLDKCLPDLRKEYRLGRLFEAELAADPLEQFARWFEEALRARSLKAHAMTLATASAAAAPSARTVLLKGFDERGFVFYSSYVGRKSRDLSENPRGTLVFYWPELERQVISSGSIEKVSREESSSYFRTRPREAQVAAWISHQSAVIKDRGALDEKFEKGLVRFQGGEVPTPESWGGYRLRPETMEFWQGRENRLNDRLQYVRRRDGGWCIERLEP